LSIFKPVLSQVVYFQRHGSKYEFAEKCIAKYKLLTFITLVG
jgi:hypothetical protein